jgi:ubiquinone/menaquinone biosynthesis C-methylase UbiE
MRGFDVVGIDVSPAALKLAKESSKNRDYDIDFLTANIYQIPFQDCSFDILWCFGVLQHLLFMERTAAIHEFHRVLRKGGHLFIEVFGNEDMRYGGKEVEDDTFSRENGIIYHYFNKKEIEGLFDGFSCKIVEYRKEKRFKGKIYLRHMISAIAKKAR